MTRRQTTPGQWLILDRPPGDRFWARLPKLPRESGLLLLVRLDAAEHRRLRRLAKLRDLTIATDGPRTTARVHDMRELRQALMRGAPLIFVSPLYRTKTHPDWQPLPRMRAAAFARLANRRTFALGGMNARRYAKIAPLGFIGWAGISAFRI